MAVAVTNKATTTLITALHEQLFWQSGVDGYWYPPTSPANSRVRIKIDDGVYMIQTRRDADQPWMLLVKALLSDFNVDTFITWCQDWPLQFP